MEIKDAPDRTKTGFKHSNFQNKLTKINWITSMALVSKLNRTLNILLSAILKT